MELQELEKVNIALKKRQKTVVKLIAMNFVKMILIKQ